MSIRSKLRHNQIRVIVVSRPSNVIRHYISSEYSCLQYSPVLQSFTRILQQSPKGYDIIVPMTTISPIQYLPPFIPETRSSMIRTEFSLNHQKRIPSFSLTQSHCKINMSKIKTDQLRERECSPFLCKSGPQSHTQRTFIGRGKPT